MKPEVSELMPEINFRTARSSGKGGQNVNKVETKVSLIFNIDNSKKLSDEEKQILKNRLANKLTNDSELIINSEESRSQMRNKENAIEKFIELYKNAFKRHKTRKATKPSLSSKLKRLDEKRKNSEKKQNRGLNLSSSF